MTKEEYINENLPFYHITKTSNLPLIIANGLQNRNGRGICVVRSKDLLIVEFVVQMMIRVDDDVDFSIIEIKPKAINLQPNELRDDTVVEETNDLHNYIRRHRINITANQVVGTFKADPYGIRDKEKLLQEINDRELIWAFEN